MNLLCPACGAELQFKSRFSVFGVCSYCSSTVVRHDMNLESIGKMAALPPDMSPLQIGTRGKYQSRNFEIIGRLKLRWEQGFWNEWYLLFEDGKEGWIAEAQGMYMVSFRILDTRKVPLKEDLSVGDSLSLMNNELFEVDDIKENICVGSEGELPLNCPKGRRSISVDLSGPNGQFACFDYSDLDVRFYLGKYVEFEDLRFSSLRQVDGW